MSQSAKLRYEKSGLKKKAIICKYCSSEFEGYKHRKFCTHECSTKWRIGKKDTGGGRHKGFKHSEETKQKISKAHDKDSKIELTCFHCNKKFKTYPRRKGEKPDRIYCSLRCAHKSPERIMKMTKTQEGLGYYKIVRKNNCKSGKREDLGLYVRSSWEANYARYLNFLKDKKQIVDWEYEPKTFWFDNIKRGCVSYLPDFKVYNNSGGHEWHEVKGYMDQRSKTKLRRMARYYPNEKLILIAKTEYMDIKNKLSRLIPNWE